MSRLSRKQIIAIILKKKSLLSGLFQSKTPAMGIHQIIPETKIHRFLRAYMKTAPVESVVVNPQRGGSSSWIVTLKGGQKGLFKKDFALQEQMAYTVDRIMGFNRAPVTVLRGKGVWVTLGDYGRPVEQPGVLMQWSKSSKAGSVFQLGIPQSHAVA